MKLKNLVSKRYKETPADCQIASQALMMRGGDRTSRVAHRMTIWRRSASFRVLASQAIPSRSHPSSSSPTAAGYDRPARRESGSLSASGPADRATGEVASAPTSSTRRAVSSWPAPGSSGRASRR